MRTLPPLPDGLQLHTLSDGRQLAYQILGAEPGPSTLTAMYHHGTPSCYMEGLALEEAARAAGIRLVAMDRCGIGASTRRSRSSLATVAGDTLALMDALAIPRAIQIGNSGGGPYAAACAALHPDRTSALVLMAALASTSGPDRGLLRSLGMMDKTTFWMAKLPLGGLWAVNWGLKYMATNHAETLIKHAPEGLAKVDGELMQTDPRVKEMFAGVLTVRRWDRGGGGSGHGTGRGRGKRETGRGGRGRGWASACAG